jgi:hypothetical protein
MKVIIKAEKIHCTPPEERPFADIQNLQFMSIARTQVTATFTTSDVLWLTDVTKNVHHLVHVAGLAVGEVTEFTWKRR